MLFFKQEINKNTTIKVCFYNLKTPQTALIFVQKKVPKKYIFYLYTPLLSTSKRANKPTKQGIFLQNI